MEQANKKQGFVQGAAVLMAGTLTVKIVSMIFKIPISNLLGGTGYSYFTNAYELFNLVSTIATAGFPVAVSKLISENCVLGHYRDNRKIFRISRLFFLITGLSCMVLTCCLMSAYRGYYQGMQNMYPTSISQMIEAVTKMAFGLGLSWGVMKWTAGNIFAAVRCWGVYETAEQAQAAIVSWQARRRCWGSACQLRQACCILMLRWRKRGDGVRDEQVMHAPKAQPNRHSCSKASL